MDSGSIYRGWRGRARWVLKSIRTFCRVIREQVSKAPYPMAKITNCFLQFGGVTAIAWKKAGERSSRESRSRVSVAFINHQPSTINRCPVATFISNSPAETEEIGRQHARELRAGAILALKGELGSGKTQFTKGVAVGLGSATEVTSPTFTIIHEYSGGRLPVYHFDFFRLEDQQAAAQLGLDDYFFGDGVSIIEWADRFPELIPKEAKWIAFRMKSEQEREIGTK
jgi:tRNA threonylcarbamoyladenosine biosynthesis protein TsaE